MRKPWILLLTLLSSWHLSWPLSHLELISFEHAPSFSCSEWRKDLILGSNTAISLFKVTFVYVFSCRAAGMKPLPVWGKWSSAPNLWLRCCNDHFILKASERLKDCLCIYHLHSHNIFIYFRLRPCSRITLLKTNCLKITLELKPHKHWKSFNSIQSIEREGYLVTTGEIPAGKVDGTRDKVSGERRPFIDLWPITSSLSIIPVFLLFYFSIFDQPVKNFLHPSCVLLMHHQISHHIINIFQPCTITALNTH